MMRTYIPIKRDPHQQTPPNMRSAAYGKFMAERALKIIEEAVKRWAGKKARSE